MTNEWKEAVIDQCVIHCIDWDDSDPKATLTKLLEWSNQIALDPAVSEEARALVETGARTAMEMSV